MIGDNCQHSSATSVALITTSIVRVQNQGSISTVPILRISHIETTGTFGTGLAGTFAAAQRLGGRSKFRFDWRLDWRCACRLRVRHSNFGISWVRGSQCKGEGNKNREEPRDGCYYCLAIPLALLATSVAGPGAFTAASVSASANFNVDASGSWSWTGKGDGERDKDGEEAGDKGRKAHDDRK